MKFFAVVDTNVLVSSLLCRRKDSPVAQVVRLVFHRVVVPLVSSKILEEYDDVLHRGKFSFKEEVVDHLIKFFQLFGVKVDPDLTDIQLIDMKDVPFYAVALDRKDLNPHLVTGNKKHFPKDPIVVSPTEFLEIVKRSGAA